jgi:predicted ATPase
MEVLAAGKNGMEPQLIGRDAEVKILRRRLAESVQGRGGMVIVTGEAGLGKTRLVDEVERQAGECGALFLRGVGEAGSTEPCGIFSGVLKGFLAQAPAKAGAALREAIAELAPHLWETLLGDRPLPVTAAAEMAPELRQSLFLNRLTRLLLDLAGSRPLVVCLEDLQRADAASLRLLPILSHRSAGAPLLLLVTCRLEELEARQDVDLRGMLQELQLKSYVDVLELRPLTFDQTRALVASWFPHHELHKDQLELLHRRSGGVPLMLRQYLEFLRERELLYAENGCWRLRPLKEAEVPESLRAVVCQRVRHLTAAERQILSHAAVQGDCFEGRLVARALGEPPVRVLRLLNRLLRRAWVLVVEDRRFRFAHPALAEVFCELLPEADRRQACLRLAEIG